MTVALVLGGAACVWDDVRAFEAFGITPAIMVACNDVLVSWEGPLTAVCSLHPDKLDGWLRKRAKAGLPEPEYAFADVMKADAWGFDSTPYRFAGQASTGSSGLFALKVALEDLGASRAVLCGIPMDAQAHFYGGGPWSGNRTHRAGWQQALPAIKGRARSMSGWTKEILGAPTPEWLRAAA